MSPCWYNPALKYGPTNTWGMNQQKRQEKEKVASNAKLLLVWMWQVRAVSKKSQKSILNVSMKLSEAKFEQPWQSKPWRVLTIEWFIPQHGLLLHHIHRDFYTGDIGMVGVVRLWEEGGRTLTLVDIKQIVWIIWSGVEFFFFPQAVY